MALISPPSVPPKGGETTKNPLKAEKWVKQVQPQPLHSPPLGDRGGQQYPCPYGVAFSLFGRKFAYLNAIALRPATLYPYTLVIF